MNVGNLILLGFGVFFVISFWGYFYKKKSRRRLINSEFKIAQISDNLGNSYYKIVCRENPEKEFIEVDKVPIVGMESISKYAVVYAKTRYLFKEEAEKGLTQFLIGIGKLSYEEEMKIIE